MRTLFSWRQTRSWSLAFGGSRPIPWKYLQFSDPKLCMDSVLKHGFWGKEYIRILHGRDSCGFPGMVKNYHTPTFDSQLLSELCVLTFHGVYLCAVRFQREDNWLVAHQPMLKTLVDWDHQQPDKCW